MMFRYMLYGIEIDSDIPLPAAPIMDAEEGPPAVMFRRRSPGCDVPKPDGPMVAEYRCEHGHRLCARYSGPGGNWLELAGIGSFHVAPGARQVDVYAEPGVSERSLGLVLTGHLSVFVLFLLGRPCLHAGAVATERGGIVFLGPKGQGKSSLTACFLRRGAKLLTDDALALQEQPGGIYAAPSVPMMKLCQSSASYSLGLDEELPALAAHLDKKLFELDGRFAYASTTVRLSAIYLLNRSASHGSAAGGIAIQRLNPRDGFTTLLAQTTSAWLLQPVEAARLFPLYTRLIAQAPVRMIRFPTGFEHQGAVYEAILEDLEAP